MAFNLAPFNNTSFNAGSDTTVFISGLIQENVISSIGTSLEAYIKAIGNERVLTLGVLGGNGVYVAGIGTETINEAVTTGMSSIVISAIATETINEETTIMCEVHPETIGLESVTPALVPGKQVMTVGKGTEYVTASVVTDKETWLIAEGYELVSASATLESVDLHVCELNVTLQPGQRMIIDAINYNIWIDGQNANWIQSGEWIDELTRETSSISVTASAGVAQLTASILYTERYL